MNIFELFNKKKKPLVVESRMNQIDQAIQERLVAGVPPEEIAQELNIPLDWVEEYKFTKVSDSPVDMFGNQLDRQHSSMNEDDVEEAIGQKFIVTLQNVTTKKTSTVLVSAQDEDDAKDMVRHHAGLGQAIINAQPARGNEQTTYVFQGGRLMPTQGVAEAGNKPGWALDPKTRLELKKRQERQKTIAKYAGKDVPKQDVAEMDKSQTPPARHGDYPLGAKGTNVKPTTAKKVVKDMSKELDQAFAKEKKGVAEEQLDEISRRDFLKGIGAAAVSAVIPKIAKGQVIGGGEEEATAAATKAASLFLKYSRNTHREVAQNVANTLYQRIMQYYSFSGGKDVAGATNHALNLAVKEVEGDFQAIYQVAEKDKEDSSLAKAYISGRLGLGGISRDEQLKAAGSLERFDFGPVAERFIKAYTKGLQDALEYWKQQAQQPSQQSKKVKEGWSGNEPTWVCVNGKKWKLFPTHDHARNVGDKLQAKFRKEGRKDRVSYISTDTEDVNENDISDVIESYIYAMKKSGYDIL